MSSTIHRAIPVSALAITCAVALAACSSGSSGGNATAGSTSSGGPTASSSAGTSAAASAAAAAVTAARGPVSFTPPTVSAGPIPKGKRVTVISALNAATLPYQVSQFAAKDATAVGLNAQEVDGKGAPPAWDSAIHTALTQGTNAFIMGASEPSLVPDAAKAAAAKGVPMTTLFGCENPKPANVTMEIPTSTDREGKLLADWVIQNSPGGADVLALTNAQYFCLNQETAAFKAELATGGPNFRIVGQLESTPADQAGPSGVQKVAGLLRQHPTAKYFFLMQADWAPLFEQAVNTVGNKSIIGLVSDYESVIPLIRDQKNLVAAGPDYNWDSWIAVYATIAALNKKTVPSLEAPLHLFDQTNIATVTGNNATPPFDVDAAWKNFLTKG